MANAFSCDDVNDEDDTDSVSSPWLNWLMPMEETESTRSSRSTCAGDRPDGRGVDSEQDRRLKLFTRVDDAESGDGDGELLACWGRTEVSRYIDGEAAGFIDGIISRGNGGSGARGGIGKHRTGGETT